MSGAFPQVQAHCRAAGASGAGLAARGKRAGQVVVELLLMLPFFFMMIFFIMEIGNIAFQTILINHCAYELARIGSLTAGANMATATAGNVMDTATAKSKMLKVLQSDMLPQTYSNASLDVTTETTGYDQQAQRNNVDIIVALTYKARLVFPGSSKVMSSANMTGYRQVKATVRMPIESPLFK